MVFLQSANVVAAGRHVFLFQAWNVAYDKDSKCMFNACKMLGVPLPNDTDRGVVFVWIRVTALVKGF